MNVYTSVLCLPHGAILLHNLPEQRLAIPQNGLFDLGQGQIKEASRQGKAAGSLEEGCGREIRKAEQDNPVSTAMERQKKELDQSNYPRAKALGPSLNLQ